MTLSLIKSRGGAESLPLRVAGMKDRASVSLRCSVLRDGAAAQYGSDAIAGVIDITLKKRAGCEAVLGYGQYSAGDGKNYLASAYCGFATGNGGTTGITAEFLDRGRSNRAEPGNPRIIGDTKTQNATLYVNGEVPVSGAAKLYYTLGYQTRDASSGAWARGGIGSDDIPSRNSAAMYPDGFVPFITGELKDRYTIVGAWAMLGGWRTDLSLNLFVILVLAACAVLIAAARSIGSLVSLPRRAHAWRELKRERAAQAALREILGALLRRQLVG